MKDKTTGILTEILIGAICVAMLIFAGCRFAHIPGKLTVISILSDTGVDELYMEDANDIVWLVKYKGKLSKAKFDPLTKTLIIGE